MPKKTDLTLKLEFTGEVKRDSQNGEFVFLACGCVVIIDRSYFLDVGIGKQRLIGSNTYCAPHKHLLESVGLASLYQAKNFVALDDYLRDNGFDRKFFLKMSDAELVSYLDRAMNLGDFSRHPGFKLSKDSINEDLVKHLENM